jgi:hypothetical protein
MTRPGFAPLTLIRDRFQRLREATAALRAENGRLLARVGATDREMEEALAGLVAGVERSRARRASE